MRMRSTGAGPERLRSNTTQASLTCTRPVLPVQRGATNLGRRCGRPSTSTTAARSALPWLGSACHTAPAITPALSDTLLSLPPADAAMTSCYHVAGSHMAPGGLPVDHLMLLLAAAGFFVTLGAVTGQTSLLEAVAHRAQRMQPVDFFLNPNRLLGGGPRRPSLPPSVAGGLTGTTAEQLQGYVHLTEGSNDNPSVLAVRNRALATAATYSVRIAVKDSQARVRQMLEELHGAGASSSTSTTSTTASTTTATSTTSSTTSTTNSSPTTSSTSAASSTHAATAAGRDASVSSHADATSSRSGTLPPPGGWPPHQRAQEEAEQRAQHVAVQQQQQQQERAVRHLLLRELGHGVAAVEPSPGAAGREAQAAAVTTGGSVGGRAHTVVGLQGCRAAGHEGMTEQQLDGLELRVLQAVAEQAALEQVEALLAVVAASQQLDHGQGQQEGNGRGHGDTRGGTSGLDRAGRRGGRGGGSGDIRGGW